MTYVVIRDEDLLEEIKYYSRLALEQAATCENPEQVIAIDPPNTKLSETFYSYSIDKNIFTRKFHILDAISFVPPNSRIAEHYLKYHREGRRMALGSAIFQSLENLPVPAITFCHEYNLKTGECNTRYYFSVIRMDAKWSYPKADTLLSVAGSNFHRAVFFDPNFRDMSDRSGFYKSSLGYCVETTKLLRSFVGQEFGNMADFICCGSKSGLPEFTAPLRKYVDYYNLVQIRSLISSGVKSKEVFESTPTPTSAVKVKKERVWDASKPFVASVSPLSTYEIDVVGRVSEMMNIERAKSKGFRASEDLNHEKISRLVNGLGYKAVSRRLYSTLNDEEVFKVVETVPCYSKDRWISHDYIISKRDGELYAQVQLYDKDSIERRGGIFKFGKGDCESVVRRFLARQIFEEFVARDVGVFSLDKPFKSDSWNNIKLEEVIYQRVIPHVLITKEIRSAGLSA